MVVAKLDSSYEQSSELLNHEAWISTGINLSEQGLYEEGIASFDRAIEINPDDYETLLYRGTLLCEYLGEYEKVLDSFNRAIEISPDNYQAWYNRGISLGNLGQFEEAFNSHNRAIKINPDYDKAWFNRGFTLDILERYEEAIFSYDRAIEINTEYDKAWSNRGVIMSTRLKRYKEAIASFDESIKIKPDVYEAWFSRGSAVGNLYGYQEEINNYYQAFQYIHAQTHAKGWGVLQHIIGQTYYNEGISQLFNHQCDPQPYYDRALTHYHKALQTLTCEEFPKLRLDTLLDTAKVYLAQHNKDAAHQYKTEAFEIFQNLLNSQPTFDR